MTPEEKARLEKAEAQAETLAKVVALSAKHREHYDGLEKDDAKATFLEKSAPERDALIAEAQKRADDADPVVFKSEDGSVEIRKSDGAAALMMAKSLDAQAKKTAEIEQENARLRKAAETATFEKRAVTELKYLPGSVATRARMLKDAEAIEDETERKEALAALKASNNALAPAFMLKGIGLETLDDDPAGAGDGTASDPQSQLDALAKKHQDANEGMSFEKAMAEVVMTDEGSALYDKAAAHTDQIARRGVTL